MDTTSAALLQPAPLPVWDVNQKTSFCLDSLEYHTLMDSWSGVSLILQILHS